LGESVVFLIRTVCAAFLAALLLSGTAASAGDYTVSYAFDEGDLNEVGESEACEYRTD